MSAKVQGWVWDLDLQPARKLVLLWLASDRDDTGQPKRPLLIRVERRISSQRNTSNVYILAVPWQEPNAVRHDLEELQHVTKGAIERALAQVRAIRCPRGVGAIHCPPVGEAAPPGTTALVPD